MERTFICDQCLIEYSIKVEPGKTAQEIRDDYPEAETWLEGVDLICPSCASQVSET